jgi:hypothetical protein
MLPDLDERPRETTRWEKSQENISEKCRGCNQANMVNFPELRQFATDELLKYTNPTEFSGKSVCMSVLKNSIPRKEEMFLFYK